MAKITSIKENVKLYAERDFHKSKVSNLSNVYYSVVKNSQ